MKKSYLAAAAILGAAVFAGQAHAVKIDLGEGKSFNMGFRAKIHGTYMGKRDDNDKADLALSVPNSRIYAKGSISKIFKWGWQGDFAGSIKDNDGDTIGFGVFKIVDAFIMLDFAKEAKVYAGFIKLPFELHSGIQSGWSFIMPTGPNYGLANQPFTNPAADGERAAGSGSRAAQLGVWGKVADGMFKYYLYLVDARDEDSTNEAKTGYGVRVEFAPTMAGYKGHPGYVLKETYLGKQNTLTVGLAYFTEKTGGNNNKSLGIDALWEQNFGAVTPNINVGYVKHENFRGVDGRDRSGWIVQGQLLFNQDTILGKPAIGVRWAQSNKDDDAPVTFEKSSVIGVTGQLYVKGVGNRIALSIDRVKDDNQSAPNKDSWTDVTLAFWYNF
ncbi:short chain amide porin [Hydrogenivirga caldilitoris]|uniref:Short chain amide porin n=1 Tax=Hydrogenivirga caldilitoris TaxID=246264 RepID=A0A497XQJ0_9AQUI|nr:porin [Hydrogenivirga caldilitoris]RLJ71247.1 short chain amide porin [Hydrogenivirga caldilitoris]